MELRLFRRDSSGCTFGDEHLTTATGGSTGFSVLNRIFLTGALLLFR